MALLTVSERFVIDRRPRKWLAYLSNSKIVAGTFFPSFRLRLGVQRSQAARMENLSKLIQSKQGDKESKQSRRFNISQYLSSTSSQVEIIEGRNRRSESLYVVTRAPRFQFVHLR